MKLNFYEEKTLEVLRENMSEHNSVSGKRIAELIGLKERNSGKEGADMRAIIHSLRLKGCPICANGFGYYYARTENELNNFIEALKNRINSQKEVLKSLKNADKNVGVIPKPQTEDEKMREFSAQVLV